MLKETSTAFTEASALVTRGPLIGLGPNQKKGRLGVSIVTNLAIQKKHVGDIHGKPVDWKPRKNNRSQDFQAMAKEKKFKRKQAMRPQQMVVLVQSNYTNSTNSFLSPGQSFISIVPTALLAHKGNFLSALNTTSRFKTPWIIDSRASDHMTDSYSLFSSYLSYAGNLKVKIAYINCRKRKY